MVQTSHSNLPKLVVVEGLMGSGKTSTARFIESHLNERGIQTKVHLEGDLNHPADFESVAFLSPEQYENLRNKHIEHETLLRDMIVPSAEGHLLFYARERRKIGEHFPRSLYDHLVQFDVYDGVSLDKHQDLLRDRWTQFAANQINSDSTAIFECCFLQNAMCKFLAQHNAGRNAVMNHVLSIASTIESLNPVYIYLYQSDIPKTIERARQERSKEWFEFVVRYHTEQAYGKANNLHGLVGFLRFLETRQSIELEICNQLGKRALVLNDAGALWPERLRRLSDWLDGIITVPNGGMPLKKIEY